MISIVVYVLASSFLWHFELGALLLKWLTMMGWPRYGFRGSSWKRWMCFPRPQRTTKYPGPISGNWKMKSCSSTSPIFIWRLPIYKRGLATTLWRDVTRRGGHNAGHILRHGPPQTVMRANRISPLSVRYRFVAAFWVVEREVSGFDGCKHVFP